MLAAHCTHCGAPCPVSLATPDAIACASCGFSGPPDGATRERLAAAAHALGELDVGKRQLGDKQRRALARSRQASIVAWVFFLAFVPPIGLLSVVVAVGMAAVGFSHGEHGFGLVGLSYLAVPVVGVLVFVRMRRARARLRQACVAVPPDVAGAPARCRVCGAPLPAPDLASAGVVRCGFCAADNLAAPDALAELGRRARLVLDDYAGAVRERASGAALSPSLAGFAVALLPLAVPLVATFGYAIWSVATADSRAIREHRFVVTDTPNGACLGKVHDDAKYGIRCVTVAEANRQPTDVGGGEAREVRGCASITGQRSFELGAVLGRDVRVWSHGTWEPGRAEKIAVVNDTPQLVVRLSSGAPWQTGEPTEVCFPSAPADLPRFAWPK